MHDDDLLRRELPLEDPERLGVQALQEDEVHPARDARALEVLAVLAQEGVAQVQDARSVELQHVDQLLDVRVLVADLAGRLVLDRVEAVAHPVGEDADPVDGERARFEEIQGDVLDPVLVDPPPGGLRSQPPDHLAGGDQVRPRVALEVLEHEPRLEVVHVIVRDQDQPHAVEGRPGPGEPVEGPGVGNLAPVELLAAEERVDQDLPRSRLDQETLVGHVGHVQDRSGLGRHPGRAAPAGERRQGPRHPGLHARSFLPREHRSRPPRRAAPPGGGAARHHSRSRPLVEITGTAARPRRSARCRMQTSDRGTRPGSR